MSNPIRPIVRAAFRCDALVYQFTYVDTADGILSSGSMSEVSDTYDDAHLLGEADMCLDICQDNLRDLQFDRDGEDYRTYQREARQLRAFIKKWGA